jgi:hypothetical protein
MAVGGPAMSWLAAASGSYAVMYMAAAVTVIAPLWLFWERVLPQYPSTRRRS